MAIKRTFYLLPLLLVLLLFGGLAACNTVYGLRLLLHCAANWLPGFTIQQANCQGAELVVSKLAYQTANFSLQIEQLRLQPNLGYLKRCLLGLDKLQAQQLSLQLPHHPQPITLNLAQLQTALQWRFSELTLHSSSLEDLNLIWSDPPTETPSSELLNQLSEASVTALLQKLPRYLAPRWLAVNIESLQGQRWSFTGPQIQEITQIQLAAEIQSTRCLLHNLTLQTPEARLTLQGSLGLRQPYPLSLRLQGGLFTSMLAGEQWQLQLTGRLRNQLTLQLQATGPLPLKATTIFSVTATDQLKIYTTCQSDRLQWPVATHSPQWVAESVTGQFEGWPANYRFNLQAKLPTGTLPDSLQYFQAPAPLELHCQGEGNSQKLQLSQLRLTGPSGTAQATAQISRQPHWQWQGQLTLDNWQLQRQSLGKLLLSGTAQSCGQLANQKWQFEFPQLQLRGNLNGQPVTLTGQIKQPTPQQWQIPNLQLLLGDNQLKLQGALGANWDLQAAIHAPKLDHLLPELAGSISGHLTLSGTPQQPQLHSNLQISQLRWQQFSLAKATLQGRLSTRQATASKTLLHLEQLRHPAICIEQLQLTAVGNERRHQLQLQVRGTPIAGTVRLQGDYQRSLGFWQATIDRAQLHTPMGLWQPTQAIQVSYRQPQHQFAVTAHRWRHQQAEVAFSTLSYQAGTTQAQLAIQQFDLALLKPWLPPQIQLQGAISGHSRLQWSPGIRSITLGLQGAQLKAIFGHSNKSVPLECQQLAVNLQLAPDQASLRGQLRLPGQGMINTSLQITDPQQQRQLTGNIELSALSLLPFSHLFDTRQLPSGILAGSVRLAGSLMRPQLFGSLQLKEMRSNYLIYSDPAQAGELQLLFTGQQAQLSGRVPTSTGELRLQGDTRWQRWQAWQSQLHLTGDPIKVNWSPDIQLTLIPNIHLDSSPKHARISGEVHIPQARIILDQLPQVAVSVSKHEVMLNEFGQKRQQQRVKEQVIDSNLLLQVGDDVFLSGFGLQGHLKGPLTIKHTSQGLGLYGQLSVAEGHLQAYGQRLIVRQGKLLFSGPMECLFLDLEAIRDPDKTEDQVVAGLRIKGFSNAPQVTIFSDPAFPQNEALSYLLNGRKQAEGQHNILAAQLSLSLLQSGKLVKLDGITQRLEHALSGFGITDLALDTVGVGNNSQIVITGYLGRDIQFKYGPGNSVDYTTLILRFRLMPRLYLEVLSGLERAVDLLYQFEF